MKLGKFDQFVHVHTNWATQLPTSSYLSVMLSHIMITLHTDRCSTFSFPWTYLNHYRSTLDTPTKMNNE